METYTYDQCCESARALQARLGGFCPKVLLILGSGLGSLGGRGGGPHRRAL